MRILHHPAAALVLCAAPMAAWAQAAPLNYFLHAAGPASRPVLWLGWVFAAIAAGVCAIIAVMLLAALFRRRPQAGHDVARWERNDGVRFVAVCTAVTIATLLGMAVYMLTVLSGIASPPHPPALTITVTGYDWWWKADYGSFETANEIHIPTGVPVLMKLQSADVIHAFWVPQLAGKTQMIPGMENRQWLQADTPGVYRGQCTQFCGLQHAHMGFEVVAQTPAEFAAWREAQEAPAKPAASTGEHVFMRNCGSCHAVRGTEAAGGHAPDLTHLGSRRLLAAGMLTNTPQHLADWVLHAQSIKPGCRMPDFALSKADAQALTAYLATLK